MSAITQEEHVTAIGTRPSIIGRCRMEESSLEDLFIYYQRCPCIIPRISSFPPPYCIQALKQQFRAIHATRRQENLVVGGLVVAGTALSLQYGLKVGEEVERD